MSKTFVITGIGTDVGKTFISMLLCKAWNASYWKPVQSGNELSSDKDFIARFISEKTTIFPEIYTFKAPVSPHLAAQMEHQNIDINKLKIPEIDNTLLIEGAGGLHVPLTSNGFLYIDLFEQWNLPIILVVKHYLGSINHTLLSIEALKQRKIPIYLVVFNGEPHQASSDIIKKIHPELKYIDIPNLDLNSEKIDDFVKNNKKILELYLPR